MGSAVVDGMENGSCPRRFGELGPQERAANLDHWRADKTCSYCGSLAPDEFLRRVESGDTVDPTDKNYKTYLSGPGGHAKFYFQHLGEEQIRKFIALLNAGTVKLGYPHRFYVRPYFIAPKT